METNVVTLVRFRAFIYDPCVFKAEIDSLSDMPTLFCNFPKDDRHFFPPGDLCKTNSASIHLHTIHFALFPLSHFSTIQLNKYY